MALPPEEDARNPATPVTWPSDGRPDVPRPPDRNVPSRLNREVPVPPPRVDLVGRPQGRIPRDGSLERRGARVGRRASGPIRRRELHRPKPRPGGTRGGGPDAGTPLLERWDGGGRRCRPRREQRRLPGSRADGPMHGNASGRSPVSLRRYWPMNPRPSVRWRGHGPWDPKGAPIRRCPGDPREPLGRPGQTPRG